MTFDEKAYQKEYRATHVEERKAQYTQYYREHRDELLAKQKDARDRDKDNARRKAYYEAHREDAKEYDKSYREAHIEKLIEYKHNWYLANREKNRNYSRNARLKVLQHYSGNETPYCECCGENTYEFLSLDHTNGDGAEHRRKLGTGGDRTYRWIIKNDFPDGFRVLCYNCNLSHGFNGYCPHQLEEGENRLWFKTN